MNGRNLSKYQLLVAGICCLSLLSCAFDLVPAQDLILGREGVRVRVMGNNLQMLQAMPAAADEQDPQVNGEAILKVDPDLESILEKAARYREDGNFTVACQLWQIVLERCGDTLYTNDGQTYYSMIDQVERILAELPEEGLRTYRIAADAEARQLLAQAENQDDRQALTEVVRKYFVSSVGDDAAFRLACLDLDQFDFVGALRLLLKIRDQHPDPSPAAEELNARIALCQTLMGEVSEARQTLAQMPEASRHPRSALGMAEQLATAAEQGQDMGFGRAQANPFQTFRVGRSVPADLLDGDLYADWQFVVDPPKDGSMLYQRSEAQGRVLALTPQTLKQAADSVGNAEASMIEQWNARGWRPVGELTVTDSLLVHRTPANLVAWSLQGGDQPVWRGLWLDQYEVDDATRQMQNVQRAFGQRIVLGGRSSRENIESDAAVQLFGDAVASQVQWLDGVVYVVEGKRYDERPSGARRQQNAHFNWNTTPRRGRLNFLTAYEASSGRVLWTLPKSDASSSESNPEELNDSPWLQGGGLMGPPIPFAELLILPVTHGGAIYVYAIDPRREGRTVWQTYLCDEPESGAEAWSPIQLTVSGSDLFVATGMGVIFTLDPATGAVRFAQRYQRQGTLNNAMSQFGFSNAPRYEFDGWSQDMIIPYGREMICFVSDSNRIFSLNRSTGQLIWETDIKPLGRKIDYVLGIYNHVLYAAGRETLIAIDLLGEGRMLWGGEDVFAGGQSLGRGLLTPDGLLVPVQDSIWQFSLQGKSGRAERVKSAPVQLGTGAPVGNLATDGKTIWVQGGYRIYRLAKDTSSP